VYQSPRAEQARPLLAAAEHGDPTVVQLLLERGAVLESPWDDTLTAAARGGHLEATRLLLGRLPSGPPDLSQAVKDWRKEQEDLQQHWENMTWVQRQKAQRQQPGWARLQAPLYIASKGGHTAVAQMLLESGRDVGCKEDALMTASEAGHVPVMQQLLQHGANIDVRRGGVSCLVTQHCSVPSSTAGWQQCSSCYKQGPKQD
jgi:ankyrin repeat protein